MKPQWKQALHCGLFLWDISTGRRECCLLESTEDHHHVPNKEPAEAKIELIRRQMSWADQVDLAYPLEECELK